MVLKPKSTFTYNTIKNVLTASANNSLTIDQNTMKFNKET